MHVVDLLQLTSCDLMHYPTCMHNKQLTVAHMAQLFSFTFPCGVVSNVECGRVIFNPSNS